MVMNLFLSWITKLGDFMRSDEYLEVAQYTFLGKLGTLLTSADCARDLYLDDKKKYVYAKVIKRINNSIIDLIMEGAHLFDGSESRDLIQIAQHMMVWTVQWDFVYEDTFPQLEDEFTFNTLVKFPKASLARLDSFYYEKFKKNFNIRVPL